MTLVALLSLAFQSFVVQTHVHRDSRIATRSSDSATLRAAHRHSRTSNHLDCAGCRQLAQSGNYLTPDVPLPTAVVVLVLWCIGGFPTRPPELPRSHAWTSRGPPNGAIR